MDLALFPPEHLHVMLNHFPVILVLLLPPILLAGIFFAQPPVLAVGFSLALLVSLFTPIVAQTGHSAHTRFEMGQIQPPLDEEGNIASEMHLDMAEKATSLLYLVGSVGLAGLLALRFRPAWGKPTAALLILAAGVATIFTLQSAQLGGRIRHPEFRPSSHHAPAHPPGK